MEEWMKKMWYIYTMEYYSAIRKNEIMPFAATWMDLEIVITSEVSQTEGQIPYDITYMWNLKQTVQMNLFTKQKQNHSCRKQSYGYPKGTGGGISWETGIDIYTLLHIKQVTNKDLLYRIGNSTQFSVMAYMGKESKKERIYVYV